MTLTRQSENTLAALGALLMVGLAGACHAAAPRESAPPSLQEMRPGTAAAAVTDAPTMQPQLRQRLLAALGGEEDLVTRQQLAAVADPTTLVEALRQLYLDPKVDVFVRERALTSLHLFPTPAAKAFLEEAIQGADTRDAARRTAIKAYGAGFAEGAVPLLTSLLDHPDVHTRNAAVKALSAIGNERARDGLRRARKDEPSAFVRRNIEAGLRP
ncbi:MAG TPA: HEAT repeat domain-containing protein [Polyangia bacterium]